jgi:hypothetical protein
MFYCSPCYGEKACKSGGDRQLQLLDNSDGANKKVSGVKLRLVSWYLSWILLETTLELFSESRMKMAAKIQRQGGRAATARIGCS